MLAFRTQFDGKSIELPTELRGAAPRPVVVLCDEVPDENTGKKTGSIWDVFGKAPVQRSAKDIDRQMKEERAEWGEP